MDALPSELLKSGAATSRLDPRALRVHARTDARIAQSIGTASDTGVGGAGRDRTDDPLLAKQVLSQLSYSPVWQQVVDGGSGWIRTIDPRLIKTVL